MAKADPHRFDDLFQFFGPVTVKRMFGGEGIFADGLMIGLVMQDRLYLRTSETDRPRYLAEASDPFTFQKRGKTVVTGYYTVPEHLLDDPEELAGWARQALSAARAKQAAPKTRRTRVTKA